MSENNEIKVRAEERISAWEPRTLVLGIILSVLSGAICMQIIGKVGVTPNTSLIGAIFAMVLARIPFSLTRSFRSLERQNLVQTMVSGAGFSAANCSFIAVAVLFLMGEHKYIVPMGIGCMLGAGISVVIVGRLFDSSAFPAQGAWPPGVATARALEAGDEGGEKGKRLLQGLTLGVIGSYFGIPAAGIGIVFIANIYSMVGLGVGLLVKGYSTQLFGFNLGTTSIPQGVMIGAGMVALAQCIVAIFGKKGAKSSETDRITVSAESAKKTITSAFGLHVVGAIIVALATGIFSNMSTGMIILWIVWCAFSSLVAMILVGTAAMRSGWFPAFAITTIFMTLGLVMGFAPLPLAVLTGYISSVGPCFADMGYDLKTGWLIRGQGTNPEYELYGRKQQVIHELIGVIIGAAVVLIFGTMMMEQGLFPPISKTFATTIAASSDMTLIKQLLLWAIPGAILQFAFGSKSVGVLFATGLLLNNPSYGIAVLASVVVRMIFGTKFMEVRDAGLIAGDGLFGFFSNLIKAIL